MEGEECTGFRKAYKEGVLNEVQSQFFESRTSEELYRIDEDPDNVINLANDPAYKNELTAFRKQKEAFLKANPDTGFVPESVLWQAQQDSTLYAGYLAKLPYEEIYAAAEKATLAPTIEQLLELGKSDNDIVRFWASQGALIYVVSGNDQSAATNEAFITYLKTATNDKQLDTAINAAEALQRLGYIKEAKAAFKQILNADNPYVLLRACGALENINNKSFLKSLEKQIEQVTKMDPEVYFSPAIKANYVLTLID